ncbi:GDYXXLXY domain-containing protein [Bacillus sp. ISL-40]|uniref:GDYXXLXY domain-containing protein n=1 Tax=unclassified Bacillus (in: firmicutes) TaxID=185979 RepID=UPI001BEA8BF9|nr:MULTISPECIES: GDYXXLXY domain-containing protein [unclassified Bacillus (in: firmicutes)]MBT2699558.1 GDYXXLXY domain-containing protein [Bacillus sp. ISL-40]MBT2724111.1 GDYXXLXY domain-containing protein [Bacillus sp. ISL-46]MBT2741160.1 GDYXXLXY domain-containing protein [Bacillus sp. ISL-77]
MNKRAKQLVLACSVPVLILLGMCFTPLYTMLTGVDMILQTKPLDPSDLFRGDYVTLQYEAEEVPISLVDKAVVSRLQDQGGQFEVFVLMEKKDGVHTPIKVSLEKPDKGIFLKGTINYIDKGNQGQEIAFIEYNLDKYFLEDNTGAEWEKASAKGEILAKLKVNNGYAVLTDITTK